jgi:hypothetical protein
MDYSIFSRCVIISYAKNAPNYDTFNVGGYDQFTKLLEKGYEKSVLSETVDCYCPHLEMGTMRFIYFFRSDGTLIGDPYESS